MPALSAIGTFMGRLIVPKNDLKFLQKSGTDMLGWCGMLMPSPSLMQLPAEELHVGGDAVLPARDHKSPACESTIQGAAQGLP